MKRRCATCPPERRGLLKGKKGHGWVSEDGSMVQCTNCAWPRKPRRWRKRKRRS